ncbi:MAG: hypothetical protein AAGF67_08090, partial [Verrucomicrobiota bacterium]
MIKRAFLLIPLIIFSSAVLAEPKDKVSTWTDPDLAADEHPDFVVQGEYVGGEGPKRVGLQAAALDEGRFHVLEYRGGLPDAGWDGSKIKTSIMEREKLVAKVDDMKRIRRKSPTMGKEAPSGAWVIFDGKPTGYIKGEIENELLWAGASTTKPTGDFFLHL